MASEQAAKVAIIGGGCAAIAAAFELSRPQLNGRFEITVYQLGWRLGGKGASGRGQSGRIEEHGLHIWLGYYDNAFRLLRECYEELAPAPDDFDVADWRTSFIPENVIGVSAQDREAWHSWSACFPPRPGLPGDPLPPGALLSLPMYLARTVELLITLVESVDSRRRGAPQGPPEEAASATRWAAADPQRMLAAIADLLGGAVAVTGAVLAEALAVLQAGLRTLPSPLGRPLADLAVWIAHQLRNWLERGLAEDPGIQHIWEVMDVTVASLVGILRHNLLADPRGFDAIDHYDWREWLTLNGASPRATSSAFVRGLYDLVFAYEDGDPARPRVGAGTALRASLRMFFTYRGALYWKMRAGMGDVIFAPYYEALRRRGVRFEFFHRLTRVRLAPEGDLGPGESPFVAALDFDVQARVKAPGAYSPLIPVKGRPCWPARPDFAQLEDGDRMAAEGWDFESHWDRRRAGEKTLEVEKDFDFVVLGVGLGEIPNVCGEILERDPRWRRMVDEVKTIDTQAFQIWLDRDAADLGWDGPHHIGSGFAKPVDTWCDMAHTIPEEDWATPPRTVLYFCSALPDEPVPHGRDDADYPRRRHEEVRRNALAHLNGAMRELFTGAHDGGEGFRWPMLQDAAAPGATDGPSGPARFDTQYWRANVNPSDRYVLSVPGSSSRRISPLDMTYDNLTIAGDWTACGLNEGCVEAAVMAGRLAAHALAGAPLLEEIVGYDHP
jgi:uncharacterized protein with NAD-binding domain and iron-sulfur cluster